MAADLKYIDQVPDKVKIAKDDKIVREINVTSANCRSHQKHSG
jgi:hypothetical protein